MPLRLTRKMGESITINGPCKITVLGHRDKRQHSRHRECGEISIEIAATPDVKIWKSEMLDADGNLISKVR